MNIDATFWVAISFFIFVGLVFYLKVPQKINKILTEKIDGIKKDLDEAEKLKKEAKNLLSDYEKKIDISKKESKEIIDLANNQSEQIIIEKTKKFHKMIDDRKKLTEQKISQMKNEALKDIKNVSVKIAINTVKSLIQNSIDKKKIENLYSESLKEAKISLKYK